jgi:hypothetical protein
MTMLLIVAWAALGVCVLPFIVASLLAAAWVSLDEPREYL